MILEHAPLGDLTKYISEQRARKQFFTELEVLEMCLQVASGVEFLHKNKIVHRDIKPDNIFLKQEGGELVFKIGDLGVAKNLRDT